MNQRISGYARQYNDEHDPSENQFVDLLLNGRRRAQGRARLMQHLEKLLAALLRTPDDERIAHDATKLAAVAGLLLDLGALDSARDPSQVAKVKQKLADLKAALAACTRCVSGRSAS